MIRASSLTPEEIALIRAARDKAEILYEGKRTPHRSCGVCLAETFGVPWRPYQALRRGGLTGEGSCGAILAGELILGELLGPEKPTDPAGEKLRDAIIYYQQRWNDIQQAAGWSDTICNTLTAPLGEFHGERRTSFCTNMAADAAAIVAETLVRIDHPFTIVPFEASSPDAEGA